MFHHRSTAPQKSKPPRAASQKRVPIKKVDTSVLSKQDRRNTAKQIQQAKRDEVLQRKRLGGDGTAHPPPKVVVIVAFHELSDTAGLKRRLLSASGVAPEAIDAASAHAPVTIVLPSFAQGSVPGTGKQRMTLMDPPRDLMAVLDATKCADLVLCAFGPRASLEDPAFDALGYKLLSAVKAQGMPVALGAMHGFSGEMGASAKQLGETKKLISRYFTSELGPEAKMFPADSEDEVKAVVRAIGSMTPKELSWREDRGYLLAQEAAYSATDRVLCLRGYARGTGFRCKHLVHLTGHGDFAVARLALAPDPCPVAGRRGASGAAEGVPAEERVVDELRADAPPDAERLRPYDATMEEQTWPTEEELGEDVSKAKRRSAARASGATIAAPAALGDIDPTEVAVPDDADMSGVSGDEGDSEEGEAAFSDGDDGWDVQSNATGVNVEPSADAVASERRRREVIMERSQEELEFPDEVDAPMHSSARDRFQKFRGLKSFRTSAWDPYEELPVEYGRIWEFESFGATARSFRQQFVDECWEQDEAGTGVGAHFCAIYLQDVPPSVLESQPRGTPFVLSATFPCEQKVTVVHGTVTRHREYIDPVKSKQELALHCGFRRFSARPIYSEIPKRASTCKKFKFSRFFHQDATVCASFYAPALFPPCRLLLFDHAASGGPELVASGAVTGADPKQLIIKRIILSGYPFRVHKSKAVVRFMFFRPEDIRWFKPVELTSKKGLRGHITESLGTHGYMKCRFNSHVKQDDTVCMMLYKRVYPKWHPPSWGGRAEDGPDTAPVTVTS